MSDPNNSSGGAPISAHLSAVVEGVVKVSAAIAAAGYIALRAHFNTLGIPLQSSLGTDRYLMEAWGFVSSLMLRAILTAAALGLLTMSVELLRSLSAVQRAASWITGASAKVVGWITVRADVLLPFTLLSIEVFVWWLSARASLQLGVDLAIGPLSRARLAAPRGVVYFDILGMVGLVGYLVSARAGARTMGPTVGPASRVLWALQWVSLVVVLVQVPIAYGSFVHPTQYRMVTIETQSTPPLHIEGLLVYETDGSLAVWRSVNGSGSVDLIERKSSVVHIGPLRDLIRVAAETAPMRSDESQRRNP